MEALVERHNVTVDSLTNELEQHRLLAVTDRQLSAANQASMGKAKLHGWLTEDRSNERRPYVDMPEDELDRRITELAGAEAGKAASAGSPKGGNGKAKPH